jgi:hypothetical protein
MAGLFGFEIKRVKPEEVAPSFAPKESDDGAVVISAAAAYGTYIDLDGTVRTEAELVTKYREMSLHPEIDSAVDEIINEAIEIAEDKIITINLNDVDDLSDKVKNAIIEEFKNTLSILKFNKQSYDIFRRWYIDGRLYYHVIIDPKNPKEGIKELRYVDPRKIRKVREIAKVRVPGGDSTVAVVPKVQNEYYMFSDKGFNYGNKTVGPSTTGIKIAKDSIVHVVSGLTDTQGTMVLSYLHKAIKALNQLRTLEDALVIYRLCLTGDTRVKTTSGWKYIKDIQENDEVYSFTLNGLEETKVNNSWTTGYKKAFEVKSKHFSVKGNESHPILVLNLNTKTVEYVDVKDIIPGKYSFVFEKPEDSDAQIKLVDNRQNVVKLLNHEIWSTKNIENKEKFIENISIQNNIRKSTVRNFLYGSQYCPEETANIILKSINSKDVAILDVKKEKYHLNQVNLPQYIDEDFARLFGFLIGDGCISNHRIMFTEGVDEEQNLYYADIIKKYFGNCNRVNSSTRKYSNWYCSNTMGAELLQSLGFVGNAKTKRFPSWIWYASNSIKTAFIKGLCDADGHNSISKTGVFQSEIELCNKMLVEDIKELWTSIGLTSGHIRHRIKNTQTRKFGNDFRTIPETESWTVFISENNLSRFEKITDVIDCGFEEMFDLEVEHVKHNFIANGIVVHNSRAPERRIWYIDVGNLPKMKAEQYVRDIMVKHKNRLIYNAESGEVKDDRRFMTMLEDYWLPRREGGRGTEVTTLPGGQTLGEMDDVLYFQKKLYQTLNVPVNRLNSDALFSLGRATEVTRDEVKFAKFITRVRNRFANLFTEILEKQIVLKGIMSIEDWQQIAPHVKYNYARDNYFTELKNSEIYQNRTQLLASIEQSGIVGKYYSFNWVRKNILNQSDEEIEEQDFEIEVEEESGDPRWVNPMINNGMMYGMGDESGAGGDGGPKPLEPMERPTPTASQTKSQNKENESDVEKSARSEKMREAMIIVKQMKAKGPKNRSPQDRTKYRSALQILAKNR